MMKGFKQILGSLLILAAVPFGLYMWLYWGWYGGGVEAFNAIMIEPRSASNFMVGIVKILTGSLLGVLCGYISFFIGTLFLVSA